MTGLLWLYPRAWRLRYGNEVESLVAAEPPSIRLLLDLLAGAVDAHLNPHWTPQTTPKEGVTNMDTNERAFLSPDLSPDEQRRATVWMVGASAALAFLGVALDKLLGPSLVAQAVIYAAFPIAVLLAMRATYLKAYSPRVRRILLGGAMTGMFLFMLGVTYLAERF